MLQCRSCGSNVTGNFCSNCGAQVASSPTRCPRCNNEAAPGTGFCTYCGNPLSSPQYGSPYPNQPVPQQQQNNIGKYLIGALGGAAAAIGGEMLLHGAERQIERGIEGDIMRREWEGEGRHHHHHHNHHHRRRCHCGHEFGIDIDFCPRCRRRWGSW